MTLRRRCASLVFVVALCGTAPAAIAWEGDVHFGLTFFLARMAGFDEREARVIATGDHRVDSGDMQFIEPMLLYACAGTDDAGGRRAGANHYPAGGPYPAPPAARSVQPAGKAVQAAIDAILKVPPQQAGFMLQKLGEALHPLQDSWAHQGTPDVPPSTELGFDCDATRVWTHPKERGGWTSHRADLTAAWPNDVLAMARATYDILVRYPDVGGARRTPQAWDQVRPKLDGFIKASTKADKARWFQAQGIADVAFLEGVTLRDGAAPFDDIWPGRRFPPVPTDQVRQHHVDAALLDFFHGFFGEWIGTGDFNAVAGRYALPARKAEIAARLKIWRLRDHGRVADIAHSTRVLSPAQREAIDAAARAKGALATFDNAYDAYFPILPRTGTTEVSPLLPFYVKALPAAHAGAKGGGAERAVALVKFRQAPYDLIAVLAEKTSAGWRVMSITSVVDH